MIVQFGLHAISLLAFEQVRTIPAGAHAQQCGYRYVFAVRADHDVVGIPPRGDKSYDARMRALDIDYPNGIDSCAGDIEG